jgi:hypothetical protein
MRAERKSFLVLPIPPAIRIPCTLMWLHDEPHTLKEVY